MFASASKSLSLSLTLLIAAPSALSTLGCSSAAQQAPSAEAPVVVDEHNARLALDWAGVYEGTVPCDGCAGIRIRLELGADGSYEQRSEYVDGSAEAETARGSFRWLADGNTIELDEAGRGQRYFVSEGRVFQLDEAGERLETRVLKKTD